MMVYLMRKQMWFVNHFKNDQVTHVISLSVVIWSSMLGNIQPGHNALSWPQSR